MKHNTRVPLTILVFLSISSGIAQDISNNTFGKGLRLVTKDSTLALKLGLRFSTLYEGFYVPETKNYADNLMIRRFRLKIDGYVISPKLVYKVEIGVSNRDIGIQLHNHHNLGKMVFREKISISKGEGRNITIKNKNGYDLTTRVEVLPFGLFAKKGDYFESDLLRESLPKLSIGVTYDYNYGAERSRGQLGSWLSASRNLSTWFLDAIYKHKGFSAMAEYANRQTGESAAVEVDSTGSVTQAFYTGKAINGQAAYLFKNNIEIGARYTSLVQDPDTQREDIKHYTLGISKYFVGHSPKSSIRCYPN